LDPKDILNGGAFELKIPIKIRSLPIKFVSGYGD